MARTTSPVSPRLVFFGETDSKAPLLLSPSQLGFFVFFNHGPFFTTFPFFYNSRVSEKLSDRLGVSGLFGSKLSAPLPGSWPGWGPQKTKSIGDPHFIFSAFHLRPLFVVQPNQSQAFSSPWGRADPPRPPTPLIFFLEN